MITEKRVFNFRSTVILWMRNEGVGTDFFMAVSKIENLTAPEVLIKFYSLLFLYKSREI